MRRSRMRRSRARSCPLAARGTCSCRRVVGAAACTSRGVHEAGFQRCHAETLHRSPNAIPAVPVADDVFTTHRDVMAELSRRGKERLGSGCVAGPSSDIARSAPAYIFANRILYTIFRPASGPTPFTHSRGPAMRTRTSRCAVLIAALAIRAGGLFQATATVSTKYDGAPGLMLRSNHHHPMEHLLERTSPRTSPRTSTSTTRFRGHAELFA